MLAVQLTHIKRTLTWYVNGIYDIISDSAGKKIKTSVMKHNNFFFRSLLFCFCINFVARDASNKHMRRASFLPLRRTLLLLVRILFFQSLAELLKGLNQSLRLGFCGQVPRLRSFTAMLKLLRLTSPLDSISNWECVSLPLEGRRTDDEDKSFCGGKILLCL